MRKEITDRYDKEMIELGRYEYLDLRLSSSYVLAKNVRTVLETVDLKGKRVLDVGCGDGQVTRMIWEHGRPESLLGVDPSGKAIESANEIQAVPGHGLTFRHCFSSDLVEEKQHYDVVICHSVLQHIEEPKEEIARLMQLGDLVYILDPNGLNPVFKLKERFSRYHKERKVKAYPISTFREWVEQLGGVVEKAFNHGFVPYLCPDFLARVFILLEPLVECVPFVNSWCCGRSTILIRKK